MATFQELKTKGNEHFKIGQFQLAVESYSKALEVSPANHIALSNRSLAFYKMKRYEAALDDASESIEANKQWAKGYLRKASALNALGKYEEAKEVCVNGFNLQDQGICNLFVEEWLKASRSMVDTKYDALKKPPWVDIIPEAADLFCNEYCSLLYTVTYLRLSDAQSMSHETMTECVLDAIKIAEDILKEFRQPSTVLLQEWGEVATILFESYPKSEWGKLMEKLHEKTSVLFEWLKNDMHKSIKVVMDPVLMLALSAMLVRGNVLCQAYTGHHSTEYLGYACVGFFEQGVLTHSKYISFYMAVLSMILNSYRFRGALDKNEVELIRGLCHKLESLLHLLPKNTKNYQPIAEHYQHTVKVFREICAKVITGFTGSHDPNEALSELELALLKCDENPDMAMDVAIKYLTDIAGKTAASEGSSVSHINFIDAENMLYITGILASLSNHDKALAVFNSGESMALSLLATILENNVLSLDDLPPSIANCRKLALSGAIWLKDHSPKHAADVFIRWKSLFTELRATLIHLGLRDCYREAFQAIQENVSKGNESVMQQIQSDFRTRERTFLQKFSLAAIKSLYNHDYDSVAKALKPSDVAIDYTFKIYNPKHHNPPQSQACVVVISPNSPPMIITISDKHVYDLLQQWPQAIYKLWKSQDEDFIHITNSLSDILFPQPVRQVLLDPSVTRVFISPDADLMCFPIDQLPVRDDHDGSVLPLYERVSVSILSSPRELLREASVKELRSFSDQNFGGKQHTTNCSPTDASGPTSTSDHVDGLTEEVARLQLDRECVVVANPDYNLEHVGEPVSSWGMWLKSFSAFLGSTEQSEKKAIPELKGSQKEAEDVCRFLHMNNSLKVHPPITQQEAKMSTILNLKSPFILHLATHGYTSKQESTPYRGNFWTDESSGILLAGAQTFLDGKFENMDVKAGTGHMNSIAMCGMQLERTRLVFVSACESSVGLRPSQEMPNSITHALRAAGAQTVISTLWVVSDVESTEFVSYFYERLMTHPGCPPSEALSYAKAMMKHNGHSMFHWGAYVCHGLDYPIDIDLCID